MELPAVYSNLFHYASLHNYEISDALFEVYALTPDDHDPDTDFLTEVYLPVRRSKD